MTKTKMANKNKSVKTIKVWAVFDDEDNLVGAHHTKKYIAEMNAFFVIGGKIKQATITYNVAKKAKKK